MFVFGRNTWRVVLVLVLALALPPLLAPLWALDADFDGVIRRFFAGCVPRAVPGFCIRSSRLGNSPSKMLELSVPSRLTWLLGGSCRRGDVHGVDESE